jgi:monoamine oxidase
MDNFDVIVIGAGAAGLAAAVRLGSAGLSTLVIEARERIGGRVFTQRDPVSHAPIELGAEFIHGRPREMLELLKTNRVKITEVGGDSWCSRNGLLSPCNFYSQIGDILGKMDDQSPDESFLTFLNRCCADPRVTTDAKQRALAYVSGFNAADPALVGVHWLVESIRAEEKIQGDRAFRSQNGYEDLITIFQQQLVDAGVSVTTGTVVETVRWARGRVDITAKTASGTSALVTGHVLVTLPLGVLQAPVGAAGAVQFLPPLPDPKHLALRKLEMGKAIRITLRFQHRFWEDITPAGGAKSLANLGPLFTQDVWFPTWWTPMPDPSPLITGWAPFSCADRLSGKDPDFVIARALETLSRVLHAPAHELEGLLETAYSHDWQSDPYSRGAYSYGAVGSGGMQATLGSPVQETLYFAGEATDVTGNNGTVNGAIASGLRAAAEILMDTKPRTRHS